MLIGLLLAVLISNELWQTIFVEDANEPPQFDMALLAVQCHVAIYLVLCLRTWLNYQTCTRNFFSSTEGIELNWLRRILWIFAAMWIIWLLTNLFAAKLPSQTYLDFAFPFGIYFLGYSALMYRNAILPEQIPLIGKACEAQSTTRNTKYQRAFLSGERNAALQKSLAEIIQRDLPFLDPALNLATLATSIGASSHELSQLLNEELNESFYDFINRQRIQEVQRCLKDPAHATQTILDIALQCGFNSKAAFNAAFKRVSGCTPSQFRKG